MNKKTRKPQPPADDGKPPAPATISRRTLRLTIAYHVGRFELLSQSRVEKITPPSLTPPPDQNSSGYWVELRDKRGRYLFHRVLPDAIRDSAEVYSPNEPLKRARLREIKGQFEVLLPDREDGAEVIVMGHPITEDGLQRQKPCRPLAKFPIRAAGKESHS